MGRVGPVTLVEVARAAGVSTTTASAALRNSGRVSARTRELVEQTAARMRYSPNTAARSLRGARTGAIGLHLPEILTRSEYFMSFVLGVVDEAGAQDLDVVLITGRHAGSDGRFHRVDGLVLGDPLATDPVAARIMAADIPVVTCERYPGPGSAAGVVLSDHGAMLTELLDHLLAAGARRPALLASSSVSDWGATLQRAFLEWCRGHDCPPILRELPYGATSEVVRETVGSLLVTDPGMDALVCAPDGSAVAALPALREAGRAVGTDLLLAACVDSTPQQHSDPPITAIDLRPREAGAASARLLLDIIAGRAPHGTEQVLPIGLDVRASTRGG
ncbi:LacI family DNA-binding transcriptional regulator [Pseudonocardia sp. TRM90224]|uniref:LacI family DNA-binding transcriptional regulator n=1 Tax=Pseudonocardia sp. TRM90224 TaxID=2812678 RepID=UPI001E4BB1F5|nr:LacI family DNA-binding transcriptional regulator [Pseudonocardia sp. TRM90224]